MNLQVPYLVRRRNRDGSDRYYWIRDGRCVRLKGTIAQIAGKADALNEGYHRDTPAAAPVEGTVAWAVDIYRHSDAFTRLSVSTRRAYEPHMLWLETNNGRRALAALTPGAVDEVLSKVTPSRRGHCAAVIKAIVRIGRRHRHIDADTAKDIAEDIVFPNANERDQIWEMEHEAAMHAACDAEGPIGAKIKLGCILLVYTGQRPGDVVHTNPLGWQQYIWLTNPDTGRRERWIKIRQQKTCKELLIPCYQTLVAALDEARSQATGTLIVSRPNGLAFSGQGWREYFNRIRKAAGLDHLQARDFRRTAATRLGEIPGMSDADISSIIGHQPGSRVLNRVYRQRTATHARRVINLWESTAPQTKSEQDS